MPHPISNYTINVDRLELMLSQNDHIIDLASLKRSTSEKVYKFNGVLLEQIEQTSKSIYQLQYAITINNTRFGTLSLDCIGNYANAHIKLSLTNRTCYTDWLPVLNTFLFAFNCEINNITYLEIALDTNDDVLDNFYTYFFDEQNYILASGLRVQNEIETYSTLYRNQTEDATLYLGKTAKRVAMYNKSSEIIKNSKCYITDFHKANGLDTDQDVYRIELRLRNNALKRSDTVYQHKFIDDTLTKYQFEKLSHKDGRNYTKHTRKTAIDLSVGDLTDANRLSALFELLLPSVLQFREKNGTKNISRLPKVEFITFKTLNAINYITTIDKTKNQDRNMKKNAINQLIKMYSTTKADYLRKSAFEMAHSANLVEYYDQQLMKFNIQSAPVNATGMSLDEIFLS